MNIDSQPRDMEGSLTNIPQTVATGLTVSASLVAYLSRCAGDEGGSSQKDKRNCASPFWSSLSTL